ncbi:DNA-3-methyladenine glycosylase 2 family protein [Ruminococcaceae bacterium OttesenSCG-928-I18]|nr:DNA-3-methyladenine glycosylase 2 family protein [Ruminococcaceae bacterium OttesenSCG-928-I18]
MYTLTLPHFHLPKIAESGQCFRLNALSSGAYSLVAGSQRLVLTQTGPATVRFACSREAFEEHWADYFDLGTDYGAFEGKISSDDLFLQEAAEYGRGIRILRQDPWEMLITFILSQRKNIPAIKKAVENLCRCFGEKREEAGDVYYAFPTPGTLASQTSETLAGCSLGYRTPYVLSAAKMVAENEIQLKALASLSNEELHKTLLTIPGVGAKVANCILLFGYHRIDAFPIDVWIQRVIDEEYGGIFPIEKYPGFAGVLQQYLFFYARSDVYRERNNL